MGFNLSEVQKIVDHFKNKFGKMPLCPRCPKEKQDQENGMWMYDIVASRPAREGVSLLNPEDLKFIQLTCKICGYTEHYVARLIIGDGNAAWLNQPKTDGCRPTDKKS